MTNAKVAFQQRGNNKAVAERVRGKAKRRLRQNRSGSRNFFFNPPRDSLKSMSKRLLALTKGHKAPSLSL